jgi:hypothetical protein
LGLARANTKDLWDESVSGVNFLGDAGFGWSFIHNEKMTLTLTGNIGLSICSYKLEEKYTTTSYSSTVVADRERKLTPIEFYFGPEIAFTYRFNKHFGAFADVGFFYATGSAKLKNKAEALGIKLYDTSASLDISGLLIVPKVGVSFTF